MNNIKTINKNLDFLSSIALLITSKKYFYNTKITLIKLLELAYKYSKFGHYIVSVCENKIIGFLAYYEQNEQCYISMLTVVDKYRKKGVATKMLNEIKTNQKKKMRKYITLEVKKSNDKAINLYKKNDFVLLKELGESVLLRCYL